MPVFSADRPSRARARGELKLPPTRAAGRRRLALDPDSAQDRLLKAVLCYNTSRAAEGLAEVDWIFENQPEGILLDRLQQLRDALDEMRQRQEEQ